MPQRREKRVHLQHKHDDSPPNKRVTLEHNHHHESERLQHRQSAFKPAVQRVIRTHCRNYSPRVVRPRCSTLLNRSERDDSSLMLGSFIAGGVLTAAVGALSDSQHQPSQSTPTHRREDTTQQTDHVTPPPPTHETFSSKRERMFKSIKKPLVSNFDLGCSLGIMLIAGSCTVALVTSFAPIVVILPVLIITCVAIKDFFDKFEHSSFNINNDTPDIAR